ncbi:GNAT family N-acetyltransferase [bacterium]|nr:GNAT family N-acetyltransferase [bacterium]
MRQGQIIKKFISKKGNEIILRTPKQTDAKLLMEMINSVVQERDYILMTKKATLAQEKVVLNKWLKEIKNKKKLHIVVVSNNKIIGGSEITKGTGARSHVGRFGIVLMNGFREEGIGSIVMKEIIDLAKKVLKLKLVTLEVYGTNARAQGLYKKIGFKQIGTLPKAILRKGRYIEEHIMYKEL